MERIMKITVLAFMAAVLVWMVVYIAENVDDLSSQVNRIQSIFHAISTPRVI